MFFYEEQDHCYGDSSSKDRRNRSVCTTRSHLVFYNEVLYTHNWELIPTQGGHNVEFTPSTEDVEAAIRDLQPLELIWHQEQAGIISNGCQHATARKKILDRDDMSSLNHSARVEDGRYEYHEDEDDEDDDWWGEYGGEATRGLYWQLYKSLAAFRMAQRKEAEEGFQYDWVVRTRFDLAWLRPLPPLQSFSRDAVLLGSDFW